MPTASKEDPPLAFVWLQKDDAAGRRAYAEAFEKEKKIRLFKGLVDLHLVKEWNDVCLAPVAEPAFAFRAEKRLCHLESFLTRYRLRNQNRIVVFESRMSL